MSGKKPSLPGVLLQVNDCYRDRDDTPRLTFAVILWYGFIYLFCLVDLCIAMAAKKRNRKISVEKKEVLKKKIETK